jgi:DNA-binding transcriptional MerR regulator
MDKTSTIEYDCEQGIHHDKECMVPATYNVRVVTQETGLKPDTLRVWERRYGLPRPQRSSGGHRLYSERDIATVKWLMARKREGMSIGRAAALWKSLEAEGKDPLAMAARAAAPTALPPAPAGGATLADMRQEWIAACLAFDEQRAEGILAQAFALYPPETVALELLQKGVAHIGDNWYRGQTTVQQEHFASSLAMRRLHALLMSAPPPTRPGRILVASPPEEAHDLGLLLLAFLLRRRGWHVVFLGACVPQAQLETTLAATRPQLIILAAQQLRTAATLADIAQTLQGQGFPLAFGGRVFNLLPDLRARIPGHFLGEGIDDGVHMAEQILVSPYPLPAGTKTTSWDECQGALSHYRERQPAIESDLWTKMRDSGIPYASLAMANSSLAEDIMAALRLGDINYLGVDIDWIAGLLEHHGTPAGQLGLYLKAYYQAARTHLDGRGQLILDWLERTIRENGL